MVCPCPTFHVITPEALPHDRSHSSAPPQSKAGQGHRRRGRISVPTSVCILTIAHNRIAPHAPITRCLATEDNVTEKGRAILALEQLFIGDFKMDARRIVAVVDTRSPSSCACLALRLLPRAGPTDHIEAPAVPPWARVWSQNRGRQPCRSSNALGPRPPGCCRVHPIRSDD